MPQNEQKNSVAAVVVTYNRLDLLKQCVKALRGQTVPCDILIVNNASTDGTEEWLTAQTNLLSRNTGSNLGGAGGFNYGIRWAAEAGYDDVWIMDDDTLPKPDALERLLEADRFLKGDYGWLSSVALWIDGSECKMNRQKLKKSRSPNPQLIPAVQATFVSLFLPLERVYSFGLPIKDFFLWGDDIEFTRRIAVRGGKRSYVVQTSQVIHAMKNNNGSNIATDKEERLSRYQYAFRNENYLYRKEGVGGFIYYTAKCLFNMLKTLILAEDHRFKRLSVILRAYFSGFSFEPQVERIETSTEKIGVK